MVCYLIFMQYLIAMAISTTFVPFIFIIQNFDRIDAMTPLMKKNQHSILKFSNNTSSAFSKMYCINSTESSYGSKAFRGLMSRLNNKIYNFISNRFRGVRYLADRILRVTNKRKINRIKILENKINSSKSLVDEKFLKFTSNFIDNEVQLITKYGDMQKDIELAELYLSNDTSIWTYIGEDDGIEVYKTFKTQCKEKKDRRWICVMAKSNIEMPGNELKTLLLDSSKVKLFNQYSEGRTDVEVINSKCKVVWARTKIPYTIKPFDFCTLIRSWTDTKTGIIFIISKAVEHSDVPIHSSYARSHVLFGLNALIPNKENPNFTTFVSINHVKYDGIIPAFVSSGAFKGTVNYIKSLKKYINVANN